MGTPWPTTYFYMMPNSAIVVAREVGGANEWMESSFSMDMWVRYTWPTGVTNIISVIFNAGGWAVKDACLTMMITIPPGGGAYLNVTDGDDILNDLNYNILDDFFDVWNFHWVHLALTYDDNTLKLYVNGKYVDQKPFVFDKIAPDFFQLGSLLLFGNTSWIGNISGFRLWEDKVLSDKEVAYIKDKSFYDKSSFSDEYDTLYHNLLINMFTTASGVTSIPGGYDPANNVVILTQ